MIDWDLVIIGLLAEDEEEEVYKNKIKKKTSHRSIWVHNLWRNRRIHGEFHTLSFDHIANYPEKFYDYYKMDYQKFQNLLNVLRPYIEKQKTNYRPTISIEERLFLCLR